MIGWEDDNTPLCVMRCMHLAECEIDEEPHCIECADDVIERMALMDINPELVSSLPSLSRAAPYMPKPRSLSRNISGDSEELRAQRAAWKSYAEAHGLPVEAAERADRQPAPSAPDRESLSGAQRGLHTPGGGTARRDTKPPVSQLNLLDDGE